MLELFCWAYFCFIIIDYVAMLFIENAGRFAGFGLACHLGVLADLPTIGIGKNVRFIKNITVCMLYVIC